MLAVVDRGVPDHPVCECITSSSLPLSFSLTTHLEAPRLTPLHVFQPHPLQLSLQFLGDKEAAQLGFSREDVENLPAVFFAGTRGALWQSDFLTNHSLECLQIIILSGVYLVSPLSNNVIQRLEFDTYCVASRRPIKIAPTLIGASSDRVSRLLR